MTVAELRAMARQLGLKGYTQLRKAELVRELKRAGATPQAAPVRKNPARKKPKRGVSKKAVSVSSPMPPTQVPKPAGAIREDIEQLPPPPADAVLCVLPQKPGVIYVYWILGGNLTTRPPNAMLRLVSEHDGSIQVLAQIPLPAIAGDHYFHTDIRQEPGDVHAEIGSYAADGTFHASLRRNVAGIPSVKTLSTESVPRTAVDQRFRELYQHAGAPVTESALGWDGSVSSEQLPAPKVSSRER